MKTTQSILCLTAVLFAPLTIAEGDEDAAFDSVLGDMPNNFMANDFDNDEAINGRHLNPTDFSLASDLPLLDPLVEEGEDPILSANAFEGDIVNVSKIDIAELRMNSVYGRNAIRNQRLLWRNDEVPYVISNQYNNYERGVIASAFAEYHAETCIKFVPRTNQRDYIHIHKGSGCSSSVGRVGGRQQVSLGRGCVYKGIVEHELMHALGFWHEQSRADRDSNVEIVWGNINPSMKYNFMKYSLTQITHLDAPYDTCSVMHYSGYAFSSNGRPTIRKKGNRGACKLGQRKGFSEMDVKKINTLYKCAGYPQTTGTTSKPKPKPTESVPTVKPDLSCQDSNKYCADWAKQGECQVNPSWMLKNCPVSCKECKNKCADHEVYCNEWKAQGECQKNSEYMNIYCARSCGKCKAGGSCKDDNSYCQAWSEKGYCTKGNHVNYMKLRCKAACGLCP